MPSAKSRAATLASLAALAEDADRRGDATARRQHAITWMDLATNAEHRSPPNSALRYEVEKAEDRRLALAAAELGRRGGSVTNPKKAAASRANGRRGGRPAKQRTPPPGKDGAR